MTLVSNPPHWPNTGKYDKIAFKLSTDHHILGIRVGSTDPERINVQITARLTNTTGGVLAIKTKQHSYDSFASHLVLFDEPYLLTADQQYIAATLVEAPGNVRLRKYIEGESTAQCGAMIATFSNVSPEEMADSNGSTVPRGRVPGVFLRALS